MPRMFTRALFGYAARGTVHAVVNPARPAPGIGRTRTMFVMPGDHCGGETPVPIPNTEVKPSNADGTAFRRESRSSPGFFVKPNPARKGGVFYREAESPRGLPEDIARIRESVGLRRQLFSSFRECGLL
jgi:hypothetical protein